MDAPSERWLRQMQALGRLMKGAQFSDQNEGLEVKKFESMQHRIVALKSWIHNQNTLMHKTDL
ncbi:hypothetical protein GCM10011382_29270 [Vreelandella lutescens]|uniref:Uncharacterized protein n=1 Tax=Vreelandella lutescens TaxID=1602943 RepID=A0ABQ1PGS5_9GAMM|nr:hypothetical protein GCM10011382_29270 [Halomonas lutescens]